METTIAKTMALLESQASTLADFREGLEGPLAGTMAVGIVATGNDAAAGLLSAYNAAYKEWSGLKGFKDRVLADQRAEIAKEIHGTMRNGRRSAS